MKGIIDIHFHPVLVKEAIEKDKNLLYAARNIFNIGIGVQPLEVLLSAMDSAGVNKVVLLALDCSSKSGYKIPSNDIVAWLVDQASDRLIGFASVDPNKPESAVKELERAVNELGLRGLKLSPPLQGFIPNDKKVYPIYAKAQELGIPVLIHTGFSYVKGISLNTCNPLLLEDIIIQFPKLKIILAHMGWPWVWEAVLLAMKYPNVYIDTANIFTGTPTEHFDFVFSKMVPLRMVERFIAEKVIFGSDYPRIEIDKMINAIMKLPLSERAKELIFCSNAMRLLSL